MGRFDHNTNEPSLKRSARLGGALAAYQRGLSMIMASRLAALFSLLILAATAADPALAEGTIEFAYGGRIASGSMRPSRLFAP